MFKTLKGTWWHPNRFETEDGLLIYVFPYGMTIDQYRGKFPIDCYMLLEDSTVKNIVEL